ncbi:FMN-binding negative transcriptional regulator [Leifsonia sp. WHRI 6310E]|uniref:FMN-binding negative transcriptional regulator n=1 Tax=Leifsonia sp. WHRI 6310E TaxID=3162562 RepID=UPI0032EF292D
MLHNPHFVSEDLSELRALVDEHPWASIVSMTTHGLVASHYPVMAEVSDDGGLVLLTHMGRPDDESHEIGAGDMLVIVQGPHAYISSSWYPPGQFVPTWNHVTAHLTCEPEVLSDDENFAVLERLVATFEDQPSAQGPLAAYGAAARSVARGTVGLRLHVRRFELVQKLSQNKPAAIVRRVIDELSSTPNDVNAQLATVMRAANSARLDS